MSAPNRQDLEHFAKPFIVEFKQSLGNLFHEKEQLYEDSPFYGITLGSLSFEPKILVDCWMERTWLTDPGSSHFWIGFTTGRADLGNQLKKTAIKLGYSDKKTLTGRDTQGGDDWHFKKSIARPWKLSPTYESYRGENYIGIYNLNDDLNDFKEVASEFIISIINELSDEKEIALIKRSKIEATEKEAIILARRGQGLFRKRVLLREPRCRFTKVDDPTFLRASHIKPWSKCDNKERLDGENGFMLTPTYDFLFDKGFISFGNNLELLISPQLKSHMESLGLPKKPLVTTPLTAGQLKYLNFHRQQVFRHSMP